MRATSVLFALALAVWTSGATAAQLAGVNLAGPEFNPERLPGRVETDYTYPGPESIRYFLGKGMNVFRLPLLWERLQRTVGGELDQEEMDRVRTVVHAATSQGAFVVLDLHNYGRYRGAPLGSPALQAEALAQFWGRIAPAFAGNGKVAFGLMNEPHGIPGPVLRESVERSIAAIRDAGAGNLVLVPGVGWSGAHDFVKNSGDVLRNLHDPARNFAYEMHQYLDSNHSGTGQSCMSPKAAEAILADATRWLRNNKARGFLGEFGTPSSSNCLAALDAMLSYVSNNADVWLGWTYWAAGPWWGEYPFSVEPKNGRDRPQMAVLQKFLKTRAP
ncbi:MAG TPA: glycoside hydrolase family 5 protein [Azospirillum sp.]|nr:glycoside hydrolase family 5 protein [Azospirillum sp.]